MFHFHLITSAPEADIKIDILVSKLQWTQNEKIKRFMPRTCDQARRKGASHGIGLDSTSVGLCISFKMIPSSSLFHMRKKGYIHNGIYLLNRPFPFPQTLFIGKILVILYSMYSTRHKKRAPPLH